MQQFKPMMWACCNTIGYSKESWALIDWKCPTFLTKNWRFWGIDINNMLGCYYWKYLKFKSKWLMSDQTSCIGESWGPVFFQRDVIHFKDALYNISAVCLPPALAEEVKSVCVRVCLRSAVYCHGACLIYQKIELNHCSTTQFDVTSSMHFL